jgi:hypothetical protein
MSAKTIHWREWDFRGVEDNELAICLEYELSRESEEVQAAVTAARAARPDICFEEIREPSLRLGDNLPDCAYWPEFPKPYLSIPARERALRAKELAVEPYKHIRTVVAREDLADGYASDCGRFYYVAVGIDRASTLNAFLESCRELWDRHHNPELPQVTGQGRTSDRERLKWLGAWRILRFTKGDVSKAAQVCKARGVPSLYLSEKGWRKAAAAAERLLKGR